MNESPPSRRMSSRPAKTAPRRRPRLYFGLGFAAGIVATAVLLVALAAGALTYLRDQAAHSASFAMAPAATAPGNRVELYFPLEKFLAWRSTQRVGLAMSGEEVHIHLLAKPFSQCPVQVSVDIYGTPGVYHGYFTLGHVRGAVDHIPVPKTLLLSAIASDGNQYGVHVNAKRDAIYIERTFGAYQLVGYDPASRDLVISLPVQVVERAARGQLVL
ncbi:MAG: hypothetical protein ACYCVB_03665 [Bacilli bacterium]